MDQRDQNQDQPQWGQQPDYGQPPQFGEQPQWGEQTPYPGQPGWQAPPQQPQAPKKKHTALGCGCLSLIALAVIVFAVVAVNTGNKALSGTTGTATGAAPADTGAGAPVATTEAAPPATTQAVKTVVLTKSGNGIESTPSFTVGDSWALQYSFDCSNFGSQGNFQVFEDYPGGNVLVNSLSAKGSDTTYQTADAGTHSLKVNSECNWTIKVIDGDTGQ